MLPHIADRGVTLRRYPDGVDGGSFFEKRCPSHRPDWVGAFGARATATAPSATARLDSSRRAGLVGEHGSARAPRPDGAWHATSSRRRWCVFDLDPGPETAMPECAARRPAHPRACCDHLGRARAVWPRRRARRACSSTCPSTRRTPTSRLVVRAGRRPAAREGRSQARHRHDGEVGPHRQGVRRLEPEQPSQDDHRRLLAAGAATPDRVDAGQRGTRSRRRPTATPLTFEIADVLDRVDEHGDLFAEALTVEQQLPDAA